MKRSKSDHEEAELSQDGLEKVANPKKSIWEIMETGNVNGLQEFVQDLPIVKGYFNEKGITPLGLAIRAENVAMVKLLLAKGAAPCEENEDDHYTNPTYFEGLTSKNTEIQQLILNFYPINELCIQTYHISEELGHNMMTPLSYCLDADDTPERMIIITKLLLEKGANPNIADKKGKTSLHYAAYPLSPEIMDLLLEHKADPKMKDDKGYTPLHAVLEDLDVEKTPQAIEAAKKLIAKGGDINAKNSEGDTPLHIAAQRNSISAIIVKALLQLGADPKITNNSGNAPIHYAARNLDVTACTELLEYADNGWLLNKKQASPLRYAIHKIADPNNLSPIGMTLEQVTLKFTRLQEKSLPIALLLLSKATTSQEVLSLCQPHYIKVYTAENQKYYVKVLAIGSEGLRDLSVAIFYSARRLMVEEQRCIPTVLSAQHAEALLLYIMLQHALSINCKINPSPIMLDYFKDTFLQNHSAAALQQFVKLHEIIESLQAFFQSGTPISIQGHHTTWNMFIEIHLCTSAIENAAAWLPMEIQDVLVSSYIQIPTELLWYLKSLPHQSSIAKTV